MQKVLGKREEDANKKVFNIYNLKKDDFDTEQEFDDYLEEREEVLSCFIHDVNTKWAEERCKEFTNKFNRKIEHRRVEQMEELRTGLLVILPILGQIRVQKGSRTLTTAQRVTLTVSYSEKNYLAEIQNRLQNWQPNQDIPIDVVGGTSEDVLFQKALKELRNTTLI